MIRSIVVGTSNGGSEQEMEKVKRPMNAFMLWSSRERAKIHREQPGMHNSLVSSILGERWKGLPESAKAIYFKEAEFRRAEHKLLHPNYRYMPSRLKKMKKSDSSPVSYGKPSTEISNQLPVSPVSSVSKNPISITDGSSGILPTGTANIVESSPGTQREITFSTPTSSLQKTPPGIRCVVRNCRNDSAKFVTPSNFRFVKFPKNLRLRGVWCRLTGIFLEDSFVKEPYICTDHFESPQEGNSTDNCIVHGFEFPTLDLPIPDSYIVDVISGSWEVSLAQRGSFVDSQPLNVAQIRDMFPPSRIHTLRRISLPADSSSTRESTPNKSKRKAPDEDNGGSIETIKEEWIG